MNRKYLVVLFLFTIIGFTIWMEFSSIHSRFHAADVTTNTVDIAVTLNDSIKKVIKTEKEWRTILTPEEFYVLRENGTEHPFNNEFYDHTAKGTYVCAGCGNPVYTSKTKFKSGTGWPSFYQPIRPNAVATETDRSFGMVRTEVHCERCGGHLGHIFKDGPEPTGLRHCINSIALDFIPAR